VIQQLLNHIDRHELCKTKDKILLAVSGGIDSMVMLDLFLKAGFPVGVVHCNFQLRGNDSALDEEHVRKASGRQPFFWKRFDTLDFAMQNNLSIQMAARELRYRFFEEVMANEGYDYVATAHHLNDSFETALLHFLKGTGIEGMTGIPVKNERIIRPLLFATRAMIVDYAMANDIDWHEDASNQANDYQRNYIRNTIIPLLEEVNPNLVETFRNTQERLKGAGDIVREVVKEILKSSSGEELKLKKSLLRSTPSPAVVLWEIIKPLGFNYEQARDIVMDHQSGKVFHSTTHTLTVDRDTYMVKKNEPSGITEIEVGRNFAEISNGEQKIRLRETVRAGYSIVRSSDTAQLDSEKLQFPLKWRLWKPGDSFVPFGMSQTKKLSDFLVDQKIPLPEKEKITVVESNGVIVWVVGFRIHDDYKITDTTQRILVIEQR
jgi:tRNA(Ile)-lysidine synthase